MYGLRYRLFTITDLVKWFGVNYLFDFGLFAGVWTVYCCFIALWLGLLNGHLSCLRYMCVVLVGLCWFVLLVITRLCWVTVFGDGYAGFGCCRDLCCLLVALIRVPVGVFGIDLWIYSSLGVYYCLVACCVYV